MNEAAYHPMHSDEGEKRLGSSMLPNVMALAVSRPDASANSLGNAYSNTDRGTSEKQRNQQLHQQPLLLAALCPLVFELATSPSFKAPLLVIKTILLQLSPRGPHGALLARIDAVFAGERVCVIGGGQGCAEGGLDVFLEDLVGFGRGLEEGGLLGLHALVGGRWVLVEGGVRRDGFVERLVGDGGG